MNKFNLPSLIKHLNTRYIIYNNITIKIMTIPSSFFSLFLFLDNTIWDSFLGEHSDF